MKRLISAHVCKGILREGSPVVYGIGGVYAGLVLSTDGDRVKIIDPHESAWCPFPIERQLIDECHLRVDRSNGFSHACLWLAERFNLPHPRYARFFYARESIARSCILASSGSYIRFIAFEADWLNDTTRQAICPEVFDDQSDSVETMLAKICEHVALNGVKTYDFNS